MIHSTPLKHRLQTEVCCHVIPSHSCRTRFFPQTHLPGMMEAEQSGAGQYDAFTWFTQSQLPYVIRNGIVPEWFHGIISRKTSEELLMSKPPGYFLIRISESRIGYTLSYRAADRCRHFMIEVKDDGQYVIVGENRHHPSLQDLVDVHRRTPIMPFSEVLTVACGQSSNENTNYAELLLPKWRHNPSAESHPGSQEDVAPALPYRPTNWMPRADQPPSGQPNRLYPNLNVDYQNVPSQLPAMPVPRTRKRYTADNHPANTAPEVPARGFAPRYQNEACARTAAAPSSSSPPAANETALCVLPPKNQEAKLSVISNLKNLKKKFQKNRSLSQDNVYTEISLETPDGGGSMQHTNEYQEIPRVQADGEAPHIYINTDVAETERVLPREYLPPPPFAPGY